MSQETTPSDKLARISPKQSRAIMALAVGHNVDRAAAESGISPRKLRKLLREETFRRELDTAMAHIRQMFEGRMMSLANNAATVVQDLMVATKKKGDKEIPDLDTRAKGAQLALGAAVKLATRYKELQVEGFAPPAAPLVLFPESMKAPWLNTPQSLPEPVIDVEAEVVETDDTNEPE